MIHMFSIRLGSGVVCLIAFLLWLAVDIMNVLLLISWYRGDYPRAAVPPKALSETFDYQPPTELMQNDKIPMLSHSSISYDSHGQSESQNSFYADSKPQSNGINPFAEDSSSSTNPFDVRIY